MFILGYDRFDDTGVIVLQNEVIERLQNNLKYKVSYTLDL